LASWSSLKKYFRQRYYLLGFFDEFCPYYYIDINYAYMAEDLMIQQGTKKEQYESLLPQIEALLAAEPDFIANLANVAAALKQQFQWLWVGFYLVKEEMLVVGPFQGPIACTRIAKGRGVCGACWEQESPIIVPDVNSFPGHIACNSLSRSEIVVPVFKNGRMIAHQDADSESLSTFDETDLDYLQAITRIISPHVS
jgi:GAF domain-containing protein